MSQEIPEQCSTCKFWDEYTDQVTGTSYGKCFRFPPTTQKIPVVGHEKTFPAVFDWAKNWSRPDPEDICGEYKPSEET